MINSPAPGSEAVFGSAANRRRHGLDVRPHLRLDVVPALRPLGDDLQPRADGDDGLGGLRCRNWPP